ncbi:unnamed protein product [Rhizophagus irregularis]|nr:unnamed protein product [Rhizophagus irregularis]
MAISYYLCCDPLIHQSVNPRTYPIQNSFESSVRVSSKYEFYATFKARHKLEEISVLVCRLRMSHCFDLAKERLRTVSSDPAWSDLERNSFIWLLNNLGSSSFVSVAWNRAILRNKFFGLLKMDLEADVLNCMVLRL